MEALNKMQAALKVYVDNVEATLQQLSELEELAETYSLMLDNNQKINAGIQDAQRAIAHLMGQRDNLYQDFHEATFEGNHRRVEEIKVERNTIDQKVSDLEQSITEAREKLVELDGDSVALMLTRVGEAQVPQFQNRFLPFERNHQRTGLVDKMEVSHNVLVDEVGSRKRRILGMQVWSRYSKAAEMVSA